MISGDAIRGNGDEKEKLGWILSISELNQVGYKNFTMRYYFKLRKILTLLSGCQYVCRSFFVLFCYINMLFKCMFTTLFQTENNNTHNNNNFAVAALLFSLAVRTTPLIRFQ